MSDALSERSESPGDLVAIAERALHENPDMSLMDRAALATVIASGGVCGGKKITFGEIAEIAGTSATDVLTGLLAAQERNEARRNA